MQFRILREAATVLNMPINLSPKGQDPDGLSMSAPADNDRLHYTLVDDGAVPDGFLSFFRALAAVIHSPAEPHDRKAAGLTNLDAAVWLHKRSKLKHTEEQAEKSAADQPVFAAQLVPRRWRVRYQQGLHSGACSS